MTTKSPWDIKNIYRRGEKRASPEVWGPLLAGKVGA